ncbi:16S rRNA (cytosine(1402)-N(4))-methyltransferase RsmH [Arcticibacterium luteifluviistationis]|uniref:Ribosomal RNA small subunit methyltransferase H n=1 Tax=Arcticibacterium luteifluviistationis TaxID=1784714 RepID=A0A2Z4GEC9_9BACT|nr:16S rRNA (cytosine(1402)-N(4))-methyltransferase RsmH [Arcticibacterium luteifluviistationis]AWV99530.1 16S rRNA (cytosine(1402)-N(4))-methyltransferase [Arcticibacterium luteifluviistationis]
MSNTDYHVPVMLSECIEGLNINPDGIYVDITFGGGGHSKAIMDKLENGKLYSFDQDEDAKKNAENFDKSKFTFIQANFRHIKKFLRVHGVKKVDGILADLGVSSYQIDTPERGFSTRFDADLDMRMNRKAGPTAKDVINNYEVAELHKILGMYGEIKNAKTAAQAIDMARSGEPIKTIEELKKVLDTVAPKFKEFKYYAQVFQALRIEVNEEMKALEEFLFQVPDLLNTEGRLVVMSYHSLEDRMVKNYIKSGFLDGHLEKDFFGNVLKPLKGVTRKPITASDVELQKNPRSRSAKLRIAEKPEK